MKTITYMENKLHSKNLSPSSRQDIETYMSACRIEYESKIISKETLLERLELTNHLLNRLGTNKEFNLGMLQIR